MAENRTVFVTGGAGFIGLRTSSRCCSSAATGSGSSTTCSAATATR